MCVCEGGRGEERESVSVCVCVCEDRVVHACSMSDHACMS